MTTSRDSKLLVSACELSVSMLQLSANVLRVKTENDRLTRELGTAYDRLQAAHLERDEACQTRTEAQARATAEVLARREVESVLRECIAARESDQRQIERLSEELRLVTSPRESVGAVITYLRSECERMRVALEAAQWHMNVDGVPRTGALLMARTIIDNALAPAQPEKEA